MITKNIDRNTSPSSTAFVVRGDRPQMEPVELGDILTMGRDSQNQLSFDDPFVSSRHARIERHERGYVLRDLRSRNGTFLNGARIMEAALNDRDRIRIGGVDLLFTYARDIKPLTLLTTSKNESWNGQLQQLPEVAASGLPVLINGPSGSGKEILANLIHSQSSRATGPLVCVNCSALSESLIESELFGHVRGSFTGATHDRAGAFSSARGGTLFLDEIGDLPLSLQPKLLRALENNEIRPVGSDRTVETDVRVVTATHKDLRQSVRDGQFREDLYFRLNVIRLVAPCLSERMEDFEDLLYHFAKEFRVSFSFSAIDQLKAHSWPGNIRELRNLVARASAFYPRQQVGREEVMRLIDPPADRSLVKGLPLGGRSIIKDIELELIQERLVANRGNQRRTAAELGMPKSTLHDRIRTYGIDVDQLLNK